jgi:aldehyde:ferredoxin oxidoreductase
MRVNLSEGKVSKEPTTSYSSDFLGGRGINVKILYDEVPPEVAPLDPSSSLIFGVGPLCGTPVPASRTEVTAKSPETGFLGTANFGGRFGPELKFAGYDNIAITGKADKPVYLWIYNDEVEIRDASHLWGKDTFKTQEIVRSEVDPEAKIACIGPAGENLVHFATVQHELGHGAGRTGMGGVMGSKNLKAIVVRGTKGVNLADPERYLSLAQEVQKELQAHPDVQDKQKRGVSFKQERTRLRVYQDQASRPVLSCDLFTRYQSKIRRAGCLGCPTQCMDMYPVKAKGGGMISCSSYLSPFYPVRNTDPEVLLECALLAERYGIDIVSSMNIIAWLMELYENGVITAKDTDGIPMEWGSKEAILGMLKKIIHREGFGEVLADGMLPAAKKIGRGAKDYAYHIKGLPMYEVFVPAPENVIPEKGSALCLVMSSRGDTMKAFSFALEEREVKNVSLLYEEVYGEKKAAEYIAASRQKVKRITGTEKAMRADEYEGKPELVIYFEDIIIITDCLSACKLCGSFVSYPFEENYQAALFSAGTGIETSLDTLFQFAKRVKNMERAFCVREGMTRETDALPKKFMDYPIQGGDSSSVLESKKFEEMKGKYYALRGWDVATGIPTQETLEQYGLSYVVQDLEKRGKLRGKC